MDTIVEQETEYDYIPYYYRANKLSSKLSEYKTSYIYDLTIKDFGFELKTIEFYLEHKKIDSSITIIKTKKSKAKIINYNDSFISFKKKNSSYTKHSYLNYIIFQYKKKSGLILNDKIIEAKYDTIGKPYLVKGKSPMIIVGKKHKKNIKWGVINSNGEIVIPIDYEDIILPIEMDLKSLNQKSTVKTDFGSLWVNNNSSIINNSRIIGNYDGLYSNQKIIVRKKDKYGLYNADGSSILDCEYDNIKNNDNLDFYVLEKDGKYGFLLLKRKFSDKLEFTLKNEPGIFSNSISSIMQTEDILLEPKLNFKVFMEYEMTRSRYSFLINDKKIRVNENEVLNLLEE